jgi:hypothetical protein
MRQAAAAVNLPRYWKDYESDGLVRGKFVMLINVVYSVPAPKKRRIISVWRRSHDKRHPPSRYDEKEV